MRWSTLVPAVCFELCISLISPLANATTKVHVIAFGRWTSVPWILSYGESDKPVVMKIRPLMVDGQVKEYVVGSPHEVTDRLFVIRRVFRVNDSLPDDSAPRWQWQRGGWLLVDRLTGRISSVNLPEFDPLYSSSSWYRDYVAYCGIGDEGKTYAMVAQLNRHKAVLKKALAHNLPEDASPDSSCPAPVWQRSPMRVRFDAPGGEQQTFVIRGHVVDVVNDEDEEEGSK